MGQDLNNTAGMGHNWVVSTQLLENYGAHDDESTGKFSDGQAYWKFKSGTDYIVSGVDSAADAMAFVMAKFSTNCLELKEFPADVVTEEHWLDEIDEGPEYDSGYKEFKLKYAKRVSPTL